MLRDLRRWHGRSCAVKPISNESSGLRFFCKELMAGHFS
jgi:hypothetical protein